MKGSMILLVVLLVLVAMFTVQNPEVVTVRFLGFTGNTLLLVVIVVSFGAGVFGAGLVAIPGYFRRRKEVKEARLKIRELEAEMARLKIEEQKRRSDADPGLPRPGGTG